MEHVIFEPLFADAKIPTRQTDHSAGYDLYVYLKGRRVVVRRGMGSLVEVEVSPDESELAVDNGDVALLPLGFRAQLPPGYEAQVRIRSSWAFNRGLMLPNAPGTIDADYPDEWMVMLRSTVDGTRVAHGDRVAQAVLSRYETLTWVHGTVRPASNRSGGFGSTGG